MATSTQEIVQAHVERIEKLIDQQLLNETQFPVLVSDTEVRLPSGNCGEQVITKITGDYRAKGWAVTHVQIHGRSQFQFSF